MTNLTARIGKDNDTNLYVSYCPEMGIASQGETIGRAFANLREAVSLYIEEAVNMELEEVEGTEFSLV